MLCRANVLFNNLTEKCRSLLDISSYFLRGERPAAVAEASLSDVTTSFVIHNDTLRQCGDAVYSEYVNAALQSLSAQQTSLRPQSPPFCGNVFIHFSAQQQQRSPCALYGTVDCLTIIWQLSASRSKQRTHSRTTARGFPRSAYRQDQHHPPACMTPRQQGLTRFCSAPAMGKGAVVSDVGRRDVLFGRQRHLPLFCVNCGAGV
jgi:hypothetical protein